MKPLACTLILFLVACEATKSGPSDPSSPSAEPMRAKDGVV